MTRFASTEPPLRNLSSSWLEVMGLEEKLPLPAELTAGRDKSNSSSPITNSSRSNPASCRSSTTTFSSSTPGTKSYSSGMVVEVEDEVVVVDVSAEADSPPLAKVPQRRNTSSTIVAAPATLKPALSRAVTWITSFGLRMSADSRQL